MIILFGAAGSGKSVQGQRLAEKYNFRWLSVGQLLRNQNDPELEKIMLKGELVPDEFVVKMMHEAGEEALAAGQNAILDGYPRDDWQANWIVENGDVKNIEGAIVLKVSHDELWNRLQDRGREDDTKESIEKRWNLFEQTIYSMSEKLSGAGVRIQNVNGEGTIEEVTERIEKVLREWGII
jgi:adenylate kinase family enzyme